MNQLICEGCGRPETECFCDILPQDKRTLRGEGTLKAIEAIIDGVACNPNDCDFRKAAIEICDLVIASLREDLAIAENLKDFWKCRADGAER